MQTSTIVLYHNINDPNQKLFERNLRKDPTGQKIDYQLTGAKNFRSIQPGQLAIIRTTYGDNRIVYFGRINWIGAEFNDNNELCTVLKMKGQTITDKIVQKELHKIVFSEVKLNKHQYDYMKIEGREFQDKFFNTFAFLQMNGKIRVV